MSSSSTPSWQLLRHSGTGQLYYYNPETQDTREYTPSPASASAGPSDTRQQYIPRTPLAHPVSPNSGHSVNSGQDSNYQLMQGFSALNIQQQPCVTLLDSKFQRQPNPDKFFKAGKVFLALWAEPTSLSVDDSTSGITPGILGENVFNGIRRFVVIREGYQCCTVLPILTYGRRGVSKPRVKKSDHAIIYTGSHAPEPLPAELPAPNEQGMRPWPIRVNPDVKGEKLLPLSRINLQNVTTFQHNLKAQGFGMVVNMNHLILQFKDVWDKQSSSGTSGAVAPTVARMQQHNLRQSAGTSGRSGSFGHSLPSAAVIRPAAQEDNQGANRDDDDDDDDDDNEDDGDDEEGQGEGEEEEASPRDIFIAQLTAAGYSLDQATSEAVLAVQYGQYYTQCLQSGCSAEQTSDYVARQLHARFPGGTLEAAEVRLRRMLAYYKQCCQ